MAIPINHRRSDRAGIRFLRLSSFGSYPDCSQSFDELKGLDARRQLQIGNMNIMTNLAAKDKCFHIGIDVAKEKLDIHCLETGQDWQIANNTREIKKFASHNNDMLVKAYVSIDTTGGYERLCCKLLHDKGYMVHQAHSYRVKAFIRSLGQEAKNDRLDAMALALYGRDRKEKLRIYVPASANQQKLKDLITRREQLVKLKTQEKNRKSGPSSKAIEKSCEAIIKVIDKQIESIEKQIKECIQKDQELKKKEKVLREIKGFGEVTSFNILGAMPEIGTLDRKQAAALAGLAPYARDSGKQKGYRSVKGGRYLLRRALFMAALSAIRHNKEMKEFYTRLCNNGKKPIVAVVATARKLITIANARIRDMELDADVKTGSA